MQDSVGILLSTFYQLLYLSPGRPETNQKKHTRTQHTDDAVHVTRFLLCPASQTTQHTYSTKNPSPDASQTHLPERPRSWLSMRRDSCLSVPMTISPPASTTFCLSPAVYFLYSSSMPYSTNICGGNFFCDVTNTMLINELLNPLAPSMLPV